MPDVPLHNYSSVADYDSLCHTVSHNSWHSWPPGGKFSNDLRETLTYGKLLKHEFYPILRNYEQVYNVFYYIDTLWSYWNNILIQKFL